MGETMNQNVQRVFEEATGKPYQGFAEAPATVTVKCFSPTGYDLLLTLRSDDTGDLIKRLGAALDWLGEKGYRPTTGTPRTAISSNGNGNAPTCQYHGPMKRSKKFDGWFCSAKMGDGSYCKEKVMD